MYAVSCRRLISVIHAHCGLLLAVRTLASMYPCFCEHDSGNSEDNTVKSSSSEGGPALILACAVSSRSNGILPLVHELFPRSE